MSDTGRMGAGLDEDRLPWLEPAENEARSSGSGGAGTLVAALIAALVALGLVVGGVFWLRDRGHVDAGSGEGELIAAPAGAYKVKPAEPGGMKVEGQGDAAYAASTGKTPDAAIDISAVPEAPLKRPAAVKTAEATAAAVTTAPAKAAEKPIAAPKVETAKADTADAETADAAPVSGGVIQLGAFSSEANARAAWKAMSSRFAYLKPFSGGVTPVTSGKGTLYRLRATTGSEANTICGKLKVAGETCAVVSK